MSNTDQAAQNLKNIPVVSHFSEAFRHSVMNFIQYKKGIYFLRVSSRFTSKDEEGLLQCEQTNALMNGPFMLHSKHVLTLRDIKAVQSWLVAAP